MQPISKIRRATASDADDVAACVQAAYRMHLTRMRRPPGPMLRNYAQVIAAHQVWLSLIQDRIVGVLVLMERDDHLLLDNIAVHPVHRGQGLCGELLALADTEAARQGFSELRLYTHVTMAENVALYQAKDWVITGQGVENGYERIFMTKRLAS
ncbi:MAG: GNAT family N-acetyltransferase [Proteobacteria bacterium]|nr:GNAT family N-acetyltransferase [Pseudomonadota bacterium]